MTVALALSSVLLVACGSGPRPDLPPTTRFFSTMFIMPTTGTFNWVVEVDDRDDPAAAQLRADLKAAFAARLEDWLAEHDDSVSRDIWFSVNAGVIVVHPSLTGDDRWTGPDDDPALHWETLRADRQGARVFAEAFARAVDRAPAPSGARYQPLDAYRQVLALRSGCVEPRGRRETVLAEVPGSDEFVLVSAGDDDSTEPAAVYAEAAKACSPYTITRVFVPGVAYEDGGRCEPRGTSAWRLSALDPLLFESFSQRCDVVDSLTHLLNTQFLHEGGRSNCLSRPLEVRSDGLPACTLRVLHAQAVGCPSSRGWFDPPAEDGGTRATTIKSARGQRRLCEVRQLDGNEGAACRSGAPCPDCPSGFCMRTEEATRWCPSGGYRADLHIMGGAVVGPLDGLMTCMLEP